MTERRHCEWCGVFVKNDTEPMLRRVVGSDGILRVFVQILCPSCKVSASRLDGWQP